jgi:poly(beta-D-mannuronate) lyase
MNRRGFLFSGIGAFAGAKPAADMKELRKALATAASGDTILLADGVWEDADIVVQAEGAVGKPITIRAQTPGKVVLTGKSRLWVGGRYIIVDGLHFRGGADVNEIISFRSSAKKFASDCRVTRCAIQDHKAAQDLNTKWISLYGHRNRIDHCYFAGKANLGPTMVVWLDPSQPVNEHAIDYNHFGPRPPLGVNGGETIRVGDSTTSMLSCKTRVENNYFQECNGELEVISNKSCDNVYAGNTFERCGGTLTLRHGNRCLVEGNCFLGHRARNTGGVRIIGEDHRVVNNYFQDLAGRAERAAISLMNGIPNSPLNGYFQVKRAFVASNTIVDCAEAVAVGVGSRGTLAPEGCVFKDNRVVEKDGTLKPPMRVLGPGQTGPDWLPRRQAS